MKHKLQTHIFFTYFYMAMIIVLLFSVFFYRYTSAILIERETKNLQELNGSFLSQTDSEIRDLDNVSINISYSSLIKEQLSELVDISAASDEFRNLSTLFMSINGTNLNADQINLYDYDGCLLRVGVKTNIYPVDLRELTWMEQVSENAGKKTVSLPYATNDLKTSGTSNTPPTWYISLYRTLQNSSKQEIGVIETMKKCSSVFKSIITYKKKTDHAPDVYIYDDSGNLVYPYDLSGEHGAPPDYYALLNQRENDSLTTSGADGSRELLICKTSSYTRWTYVIVQDEAQVLLPVKNMLHFLIMVVFLMVGFCLVFSYITSRQLIKPIRKLKRVIHRTMLDTLDENNKAELSNSFVELEELNEEFADMNVKLKKSMNELLDSRAQELKSKNLALQSQINPHFLYNTLDMINWMAQKNETDNIRSVVQSMSGFYRLTLSRGQDIVSIGDEVRMCEAYMEIQRRRYKGRILYEAEVDEDILDCLIPKITLQPFLENAIVHGINEKEDARGVVILNGWMEDGRITLSVTDDGRGITSEERKKSAEGSHYGMENIEKRLTLYYGEEIPVQVESSPGVGTCIIISVPVRKKE